MVLKVVPSSCIRSQSLIALISFCCFEIYAHSLPPLPSQHTTHTHTGVHFGDIQNSIYCKHLKLHCSISCQIVLNVVCVVHVCTTHSLVLYRVFCEYLQTALNVLISEMCMLLPCCPRPPPAAEGIVSSLPQLLTHDSKFILHVHVKSVSVVKSLTE